jgi:hypothetical protein
VPGYLLRLAENPMRIDDEILIKSSAFESCFDAFSSREAIIRLA